MIAFFLLACSGQVDDPKARLLFLRETPPQLYLHNLETAEEARLTDEPFGVFEFVASAEKIISVHEREDGGSDIWLTEITRDGFEQAKMVECPTVRCDQASWASDGRRVLYVQRTALGEAPRLYWLDSETGDTVPVFNDPSVLGYAPQISADSRYLSYISFGTDPVLPPNHTPSDGHNHELQLNTQQLVVYDFETGKQTIVPNRMNSVAQWQPNGTEMLITDLQIFGERFGIHLFLLDAETGTVRDISDARLVEDASPAWSADGTQIAFTRGLANTAMGRQLWTMDANGENQVQLSEDANVHHGVPTFSADASQLLFQRFDTTRPTEPASVWIRNMETGEEVRIGVGNRPIWFP